MKNLLEIDKIDVEILKALTVDSRMKIKNIAKICKVTSSTIKNRFKRLKDGGLIVKPVLILNMDSFNYKIPFLIGVNVDPKQEFHVIKFIRNRFILAGIDRTFGKYDLCIFAFAKDINDLERLKQQIFDQKGVKDTRLFIWNKFHFNFGNLEYLEKGDVTSNG